MIAINSLSAMKKDCWYLIIAKNQKDILPNEIIAEVRELRLMENKLLLKTIHEKQLVNIHHNTFSAYFVYEINKEDNPEYFL